MVSRENPGEDGDPTGQGPLTFSPSSLSCELGPPTSSGPLTLALVNPMSVPPHAFHPTPSRITGLLGLVISLLLTAPLSPVLAGTVAPEAGPEPTRWAGPASGQSWTPADSPPTASGSAGS